MNILAAALISVVILTTLVFDVLLFLQIRETRKAKRRFDQELQREWTKLRQVLSTHLDKERHKLERRLNNLSQERKPWQDEED